MKSVKLKKGEFMGGERFFSQLSDKRNHILKGITLQTKQPSYPDRDLVQLTFRYLFEFSLD